MTDSAASTKLSTYRRAGRLESGIRSAPELTVGLDRAPERAAEPLLRIT